MCTNTPGRPIRWAKSPSRSPRQTLPATRLSFPTASPSRRDVDVCTWKDCKVGAESWSNDDGSNTCKTELETAGFRGTFFYNGSTTQSWFSTYTADGHEIASHTVSHPCNTPCCSPTCTPESLAACPYTITDVNAYREDQLEPNIEAIEAGSGEPVLSLAWPCGCTDPGRMEAASYNYLGARLLRLDRQPDLAAGRQPGHPGQPVQPQLGQCLRPDLYRPGGQRRLVGDHHRPWLLRRHRLHGLAPGRALGRAGW